MTKTKILHAMYYNFKGFPHPKLFVATQNSFRNGENEKQQQQKSSPKTKKKTKNKNQKNLSQSFPLLDLFKSKLVIFFCKCLPLSTPQLFNAQSLHSYTSF